jgi:CheY-like chemotaxis protein
VKVLVVDPDSRRAPLLQDTLMAGGAEVTVASSGSFALTMLEWNRHDVVVSRAHIDDMAGHELCAILKADPSTREVRFVLVAGPEEVTPTETAAAGVDLVLPPSMTGGAILPLVVRLMEANRTPAADAAGAPTPATTPTPPAPAAAPSPAAAVPSRAAAPPATPSTPVPPVLAPREVVPPPPATGVPRIRPEAAPPLRVDPPKRYATAASDTTGPWTNPPGTPAPGPAAPAAASRAPAPRPTPPAPPAPASSTRPPVAARTAVPPKVEDLLAMPSGTFQGSLEVMELADLTQAIAGGGKSGRLILALPQGGGLILFEKGRVVHAEYRNTVGEEAFGALLAACHADGAGRFCFLPTPTGEASGMPRTIDKTVDRLLLSSATAIDEKG